MSTIDEYYSLGFEEAKKRDAFFKAVSAHINHARDKHEFFCDSVGSTHNYSRLALELKVVIAQSPTLENVLVAELCEFMDEAQRGNYERAYEEACDVVAVLYRYLAGDMSADKSLTDKE